MSRLTTRLSASQSHATFVFVTSSKALIQSGGGRAHRRQAFYTNLHPRAYRFRVLACNNDGVWNESGAVLDFTLLPAFYQTQWFPLLCALVLIILAWGAYQLRVWQVTTHAQDLFE